MKNILFLLIPLTIFTFSVFAQQPAFQQPKIADDDEKGVHGFVMVTAIFRADGSITDIKILSHPVPWIAKEAISAVRKITFTPPQKDGRPVSVRTVMEFTFQLLKADNEDSLRQSLTNVFRFLSQENVAAIIKSLKQNIGYTKAIDIWTIDCDDSGMTQLSDDERREYQKLKEEALQKLPLQVKKSADEIREKSKKTFIGNKDRTILNLLIFEGVAELSKEKQEKFAKLHNQSVELGLKRIEIK